MFIRIATILISISTIASFAKLHADLEAKKSDPAKSQSHTHSSTSEQADASLAKTESEDDAASETEKERAMKLLEAYLGDSVNYCRERHQYTAQLEKQVAIDGRLRDPEVIQAKVRIEPFSVYLKWDDSGQEALYVKGKNRDRMVARVTEGIALLRDVWKLDPESRQAMQGCRYPITEFGLLRMSERVSEFYQNRRTDGGLECSHRTDFFRESPVVIFDIAFHSPQECPDYSLSKLYFDAEHKCLIGIENYGWSKDGRPGELVEKYLFHDIEFDAPLSEVDFSLENPSYKFVKN
ncbi:hypothetical protein KOR42_49120 [Thalassoglobus neptunius]|uniref:DUF1571 domain-containing protein n=1 Tax=Thalassoglobus neptunius TaxID=1938619 RepID=A0A5C5VSY5_9PLAN|nr:DUF1571 domain-containing protein [Thalassoglobus neptunius]TWT40709.1 hypothetical protein KOR42_49120 [Thalassoglobus neptunius]